MISIIIPTYNEEKFLPRLLNSIMIQDFKDYEVLVADANSKDRTREICDDFGVKVLQGGLPSKGRNNGARASKGDFLLFVDADTCFLDKFFLSRVFNEFNERFCDFAGISLKPLSKNFVDKFFHYSYNIFQKVSSFFDPHMSGAFMFFKRDVFFGVGGFDESLVLAEDHALARKCFSKGYNYRVLSGYIGVDVRRFEFEGRFNVMFKMILFYFRRLFGEMDKTFLKYDLNYRN